MKKYDAIIIGSGVAGMTAAIYLKRANLNVLVIEKNSPGGLVNSTNEIANYPGFTNIGGPELASNIFMQMHALGVELVMEEVINVNKDKDKDIIVKTNANEYIAKGLIIATGREPRRLDLPNEEKLAGHGISWCAICDGPLYKDKDVLVIGGGNSAIEEGIYLATLAKQVYVINRTENFRAEATLLDKIKTLPNVNIRINSEVAEYMLEDNNLRGVKIVNNQDRSSEELLVDGIFMFIGYEPSKDILKDLNITDQVGYIAVDSDMRTDIAGIYACGDAIKKHVYQIATAVGEAAIAATSLINDLNKVR